MEAALSLADMGHRVLLVEKNPSVGGRSVLLSKVFPTLDCASCIATPKMAAAAHHPGISLLTYSEVDGITKNGNGTFHVDLRRKATYVHLDACIGCGLCEAACTVPIVDEYNEGMIARRAAHIPFPQAVPKKAVITRSGNAPCMDTCPAGVKPAGYISLVRAGRYEEAFKLHLEDVPLVGSLGHACYAPCEGNCTRADMDGTVHIRAIKRFMAEWYYERHPEPDYGPPETLLDTRIAVVGSGPAGLTAAYHLALQGHRVTVFEADPRPGGMLRHGIPAFRMAHGVLDRDIKNITALGVEIKCSAPIQSLAALREQGFDAVFVGVGSQVPRVIVMDGQDLTEVTDCMEFLRTAKCSPEMPDISGRHVVVVGGGNVALDVARSAIRLRTASTTILYRRSREEMPAHAFEVDEAQDEGVRLITQALPKSLLPGEDGRILLEYQEVALVDAGDDRRRATFRPVEGSEKRIPADVVILAVGLDPTTAAFAGEVELTPQQSIRVDPETMETSIPMVFAGGDDVLGPSTLVEAMGQGRRAAHFIDAALRGHSPIVRFWEKPPMVDKAAVIKEAEGSTMLPPSTLRRRPPLERIQSFETYEDALTEAEARFEANRCLSCGGCSQCQECVHVCPAHCIDFTMRDEHLEVNVGAVILATGFRVLDPGRNELLGFGRYPNVITGLQMDRLLAPTRPYNTVLRPSDGKVPDNIAIVLCNGSRDHTVGNPLCCRIGCMYSAKQAELLMGALPLADITIYTIDVRAFGKGYDEFYEQSRAMGALYVRGKVARIEEEEGGGLLVHFENLAGGGMQTARHDLVVLTVGLMPDVDSLHLFKGVTSPEVDEYSYIREPYPIVEPGVSSVPGLFVAGSVIGARDIPDTILHAGAAATQVAAYLERVRVS
ncbi:MAG: FAD-dependent oxidoreductase [Acidimicrobiia bacterium]|nr:FAD-dependent oxidoreductase [Acidimicrobiia bacterium]